MPRTRPVTNRALKKSWHLSEHLTAGFDESHCARAYQQHERPNRHGTSIEDGWEPIEKKHGPSSNSADSHLSRSIPKTLNAAATRSIAVGLPLRVGTNAVGHHCGNPSTSQRAQITWGYEDEIHHQTMSSGSHSDGRTSRRGAPPR
jgi:hypothetical protein